MPANTRDIKRRIRSVTSTKQITKAMELVAASKMRKAIKAVLATRPYSSLAWETVLNLASRTDRSQYVLLQERPVKSEAIVLISSNRGLCGGFNQQIIRLVSDYVTKRKLEQPEVALNLIVLGKRGREAVFKLGYQILAEFEKMDVVTDLSEITPLSYLIINDFSSGKYDRVMMAFTDFVSALKQIPRLRQVLPIGQKIEELGVVKDAGQSTPQPKFEADFSEYLFEPSPEEVLRVILPRLVEVQIYQAVLESNASEHSARMMAMRNATENADEFINDLTLSFNQARQASITRDLAEISASRTVLTD
ncbi:MAG: ATP synthase F1 subunit gamma [Patescibacteria group bacterium]|nr:ATP synthase F1 subunit gamma [Patescibacteria group bacterium]